MPKIEIESGQLSAATHRLTQPSTTLNRRYVRRPTTIAIEEAARNANVSRDNETPVTPSRLVNLRVHANDYEAARQAEEEAEAQRILAETQSITMYPRVVEYGMTPESTPEPSIPAEPTVVISAPVMTDAQPAVMPEPTTPAAEPNLDSLAMNIAADYAAASLGTTVEAAATAAPATAMPPLPTEGPTDVIAQAAAEAIAAIRVATDPDQVSEQVASLKTFAESLKSHDSPEMRELSDTIEKFVHVAMKSTKIREEVAEKERATVKVSLPAKANRAANKVTRTSAKVIAANRNQALAAARKQAAAARMSQKNQRNQRSTSMRRSASPEELKDRAIEQALHSVATMDEERRTRSAKAVIAPRRKFRARHFAIAFACATACVAGVIYAVSTNIPDISVKVAAMQTGIQATYPSYVPRDYSLANIASEDGKITMTFTGPDNTSFSLAEEKSSWDSAALLRNFVEPTWNDEYTTTHEQGITIYISNVTSDAAWVNGGVLYKITSDGTSLTKKQVRNIVVSL